MWWYSGHDWGWGGWLIMALMMALFWGGMIVFGVWVVRSLLGAGSARREGPPPPEMHGPRTALDILRERYARGEITREEYNQMREDLER